MISARQVLLVVSLAALAAACNSGGTASPHASTDAAGDPLIQCHEVPEELCREYANEAISGPQPSGAGEIVRVTVTCELNPPCSADRLDSGGEVVVTYDDGTTWVQDWAVGSGT
jgi:hypothetical protein